jgi:hypothetical protein
VLTLSVAISPSEAGKYGGNCDHWYKAASQALNRGDHDGYYSGMAHYNACLKQQMQRSREQAASFGKPRNKNKKKH